MLGFPDVAKIKRETRQTQDPQKSQLDTSLFDQRVQSTHFSRLARKRNEWNRRLKLVL
jgi:hypothetical protein